MRFAWSEMRVILHARESSARLPMPVMHVRAVLQPMRGTSSVGAQRLRPLFCDWLSGFVRQSGGSSHPAATGGAQTSVCTSWQRLERRLTAYRVPACALGNRSRSAHG
jgi:hypothetical protein